MLELHYEDEGYEFYSDPVCGICGFAYCPCCGCDCWMDDHGYDETEESDYDEN